jgi:hypothetical protein
MYAAHGANGQWEDKNGRPGMASKCDLEDVVLVDADASPLA